MMEGRRRILPEGQLPSAPTLADRDVSLRCLREIEKKVAWLSAWIVHHANHVRSNRDGLKVGGHQASSASLATLMTALYFRVLRPQDRVAVKPHGSPVYHAIQYLLGGQTRENLQRFRAFGGAQSYPSRTKDGDDVDFSTGSVGLGAAMTLFASMVQDYVRSRGRDPHSNPGRMVALVGDAELDEGNVFESMLEGWKYDVRNLWWIVDYNRQSLDSIVSDRLFDRFDKLFATMGWRVVTLKYGRRLLRAFEQAGGQDLRRWIDECPNSLYSALVFKGGTGWRERLVRDLNRFPGIKAILDAHDDHELHALMTNLGGHDLEAIIDAFEQAAADDTPTCFLAYTIKGHGMPFAGHKDNHAGLMNKEQMAAFRASMGINEGEEWETLAGIALSKAEFADFLARVPFRAGKPRRLEGAAVEIPAALPSPPSSGARASTQEAFGRILNEVAARAEPYAGRIVTTSPDVTVSTNLGGWVNRRGVFGRAERSDVFREEKVVSAQKWAVSPNGQHLELGIAENNLFLMLAALGLSHSLFGERLLPIGTLYDPFIQRGLDALNYACYQDARFILVATPSGLTLAPEGGAHQSISTPLIGMGQAGLSYFEPAYVSELALILRWAFEHIQRDDGGSVYLRLSTRPIEQPARNLSEDDAAGVLAGAYWIHEPSLAADFALVYCGAIAPEATTAHRSLKEDDAGAGLLAVTSPDRLHADWLAARRERRVSHIERLLAKLSPRSVLITALDGHPTSLAWLGSVLGHRLRPLGVERFGQSGDLPDLYREYGINADAIVDAAASAFTDKWRRNDN